MELILCIKLASLSQRVAMRRQSFIRQNMRSTTLRLRPAMRLSGYGWRLVLLDG